MPKSTQLITDANTASNATPTAATLALAKSTAGGNIDYEGMLSAALAALTEAQRSLLLVSAATDSADPNLTKITSLLQALC